MTDRDALLALADRVEACAGPDREVDAEIFRAIGAPVPFQFANKLVALTFDAGERAYFADVSEDLRVRYSPPTYTASIDAAMTLVPDGLSPTIDFVTHRCWLRTAEGYDVFHGPAYGFGLHVPTSIAAAALRALAGERG